MGEKSADLAGSQVVVPDHVAVGFIWAGKRFSGFQEMIDKLSLLEAGGFAPTEVSFETTQSGGFYCAWKQKKSVGG